VPVAVFIVTREAEEGNRIEQCILDHPWCNPVKIAGFLPEGNLPRRYEVIDFALELIHLVRMGRSLPLAVLRDEIEAFLFTENTCTLCTGNEGMIRATPVEYRYHDGALCILSE
jgi:hypothetical protein